MINQTRIEKDDPPADHHIRVVVVLPHGVLRRRAGGAVAVGMGVLVGVGAMTVTWMRGTEGVAVAVAEAASVVIGAGGGALSTWSGQPTSAVVRKGL